MLMVKTETLLAKFDDKTEGEEGVWSQICRQCVKELSIPDSMLDNAGSGICGVKGCSSESDYYIDFE